jgi:hypothetical protein
VPLPEPAEVVVSQAEPLTAVQLQVPPEAIVKEPEAASAETEAPGVEIEYEQAVGERKTATDG